MILTKPNELLHRNYRASEADLCTVTNAIASARNHFLYRDRTSRHLTALRLKGKLCSDVNIPIAPHVPSKPL
jgi:hypothetical protein